MSRFRLVAMWTGIAACLVLGGLLVWQLPAAGQRDDRADRVAGLETELRSLEQGILAAGEATDSALTRADDLGARLTAKADLKDELERANKRLDRKLDRLLERVDELDG